MKHITIDDYKKYEMVDLAKKHNIKYVKIFQGGTYVRD